LYLVAATTNRPSMALPRRRTTMRVSICSHGCCCPSLMLQPAPVGIRVSGVRTDVARAPRLSSGPCGDSQWPEFELATFTILWERIRPLRSPVRTLLTANPHRGRMKDEGQHPFELRSPRIPTGAGCSIREGQHQLWERTETHMGVRLLGRAMLGRLVVAATKYDFVRTVKSYDLARYAK